MLTDNLSEMTYIFFYNFFSGSMHIFVSIIVKKCFFLLILKFMRWKLTEVNVQRIIKLLV